MEVCGRHLLVGKEMSNLRQKMPRLSRLRVFELAAKHLSFTEAANESKVTQAAISQQVRLLEEELGVQLFERLNRGLALTTEGNRLLRNVSEAFDMIEVAAEDIAREKDALQLRIGATFAVATFWLIPRLDEFRAHYPDINVHLVATDREFDDIAGQVDVGVAFGAGSWAGLHAIHLWSPTVFPVCSRDFFSNYHADHDPDSILEKTLLSLDKHGKSSGGDWRYWFSQLELANRPTANLVTFNSLPLMFQAACAGQGVALGWSLLTNDLITSGQLVRVTDHELPTRREFYFVKDSRKDTEEMKNFKEWLFDTIQRDQV